MAAASLLERRLHGGHHLPEEVMVHEAAPIVANSANASGTVDRPGALDRICPFGAIDRLIEIAQVSGMVLVTWICIVRVSIRLKCRVIVR